MEQLLNSTKILLEQLVPNPKGVVIMETPKHRMGISMDEVVVFDENGRTHKRWEELTEEVLTDIYEFLEATSKMIPRTVESMKELEPVDDNTPWTIEPIEVAGEDGVVLGKIGVTEPGQEGVHSVLFVSCDGTWATLTQYKNTEEGRKTALTDLAKVAHVLGIITGEIMQNESTS